MPSDLRRLRRAGGVALRRLAAEYRSDEPEPRSADIALVFVDVDGFSTFVAGRGDEAAMAVLGVMESHLEAARRRHPRLRLVKQLGDGAMLSAVSSADALTAAVEVVDAFAATMAELGWTPRLRAGVHRGTCRYESGDWFGYHVNLAARVADAAPPGRVLATANVLAGVDIPALSLSVRRGRRLRAKGVNGVVPTFRVERAPLAVPRPGSP